MFHTSAPQAIKVSLVTDEESLPELEKYLDVNYSGWRYVGEVFPWASLTIAAIMLPQTEWTDEDTDVFDELQEERLLRSYDWSSATDQELALHAPGQMIPTLLGALAGLVGTDGSLTQSGACVCNETHHRNNTVCCICYARQVYECSQHDSRQSLPSCKRKRVVYLLPFGTIHHGTLCQCEDCDTDGDGYEVAVFDVTHWKTTQMCNVRPFMLDELTQEGTLPIAQFSAASVHAALFKAMRSCLQHGWHLPQRDGQVPGKGIENELMDDAGKCL